MPTPRRLSHFREPTATRRVLAALTVLGSVLLLTAAAGPATTGPPAHPAPAPHTRQAQQERHGRQHAQRQHQSAQLAPHASVVRRVRTDARTLDLTIDSPAVGEKVHTRVLLPRGYDRHPHRRWPVLYLLHGCCDTTGGWDDWTGETNVKKLTARTDALIVMPEAGPVGYYSNWYNHGRGGPPAWETFHLAELPRLLATHLHAGTRRAVAGLSMGGTGALEYAGRHPHFFRAAASFSGRLDTRRRADEVMQRLTDSHKDPRALWGDPHRQSGVWAAHNPQRLLARLPAGYPVFVSSGNGRPGPYDKPGGERDPLEAEFGSMARSYVARARAHGLNVTADLYGPGTHTWPYWQRELARALPMLTRSIGA